MQYNMGEYICLSRYAGMREDLIQAGGGNSSCKISESDMLIKASGFQMADLTEEKGYARVNYKLIQEAFLNCMDWEKMTEETGKKLLKQATISGPKPSIETFLHAITNTYTLHTHSIVSNILMARKDAKDVIGQLFPEAMFVEYATPGIELAKAYFKSYLQRRQQQSCDMIFLKNHGMVVSADSAEEVIKKTESVTKVMEEYLGLATQMKGYHRVTDIWNCVGLDKVVWKVTDENVMKAYRQFGGMWKHAFCPDCVVFLAKKAWKVRSLMKAEWEQFCNQFGSPVIIDYKGALYICADSVKKAMETQSVLSFSAQVRSLVSEEDCDFLSDEEQNYLLNWDAEKFRQAMK